ncbi:cell division protein FtsK [Pontibacillus yanchengensis]|uniref:Cell division protein FtsK n=2 Tax=Pontibacillus yanchengensis TaxID=462910 RepID=A0ACC7VB70_9BACI|nr:DNA translocase FtsK [Pontibacillus yanchengensis]MYL33202.1 cell division protein FtsK [Pontibacillus yanchengensis]MYL51948.1 cell division protein FtsK [Pontibacillus yanchengensis]
MAKKKRKGNNKKQTHMKDQVKFELIGLFLLFLAVFGSGASAIAGGAIPSSLEHLFQFFFGIWYFIVSVFLSIVGIYLMIQRKWPTFLHKRFIGFYIIFASLLLLTHVQSFEEIMRDNVEPSILRTTWNHYGAYLAGDLPSTHLGGGMIGASLFAFTYYLFAPTGAKIVAFFAMIVGVLFLTEISLGNFLQKIIERMRDFFQKQWEQIKDQQQDYSEKKAEKKKQKEESQAFSKEQHSDEQETSYSVGGENDEEPIIQDFTDVAYGNQSKSNNDSKPDESVQGSVVTESQTQDQDSTEDNQLSQSLPLTEIENFDYKLPSMDLLAEPTHNAQQQERSKIQATVKKLEQTFHSFGVKAKVTKVHVGPSVTKYEVYPDVGVKVSKIVNLHDDLALALAAKDIRIEAPIPGKSAVGIEVPNQEIATVSLREVLESHTKNTSSKLLFALGRDIAGESVVSELNKMPHMLVAGATGSGKSVCINGIITSILMRAKPHEVKMMMIDPKKVELNMYNGIPHLLSPVVTDPKKASRALKKVVDEMERRYELFSDTGTRNIEGYNEYVKKYNHENNDSQPQLPYIVVLVDELADLMMVASNDVEDAITRLAQMARAAGIHLIIATQRPSVDVITGVIKANIPSRIAFSVSSATDSRTILDTGGAEKLLGRGDMLFIPVGSSKPTRVQGAFLSDEEVERIVDHCVEQQKAQYQEEMIPDEEPEKTEEVDDDLYDDAVQLVVEMQSASVSMLQRRFRIGYTRAARLIDAMEDRNIVGPYGGSKPRDVLVSKQSEEQSS